jgi:hypothetical protein
VGRLTSSGFESWRSACANAIDSHNDDHGNASRDRLYSIALAVIEKTLRERHRLLLRLLACSALLAVNFRKVVHSVAAEEAEVLNFSYLPEGPSPLSSTLAK